MPPTVIKLVNWNVVSPCVHRITLCDYKRLIYDPEMYMKGQNGPNRVNRGTYPTLKEPYKVQMGAIGPVWAGGGHWGPVNVGNSGATYTKYFICFTLNQYGIRS